MQWSGIRAGNRAPDSKRRDSLSTGLIRSSQSVYVKGRHCIAIGDRIIYLTLTEFQILYNLAQQRGWVFTRYQIVEAIRGENYHVTDRSVDVVIFGLRKKLGEYSKYIETVRGVGYRFSDETGH